MALAPRVIEPGLGASEVLPGEVAANRRHAVALCALAAVVPAVVVGVVVALVASLVLGAVALVAAEVVFGYGLWRAAPGVALRQVGAVQVHEHDHPLVFNVAEGLCATFGLRMPRHLRGLRRRPQRLRAGTQRHVGRAGGDLGPARDDGPH